LFLEVWWNWPAAENAAQAARSRCDPLAGLPRTVAISWDLDYHDPGRGSVCGHSDRPAERGMDGLALSRLLFLVCFLSMGGVPIVPVFYRRSQKRPDGASPRCAIE